MQGVVCQAYRVTIISDILSVMDNWVLGLFVSNHTPLVTDTASTYTAIEASYPGYARQSLTSWGTPYVNGSNQGESDHPIKTFTYTGSGGTQQVYGYFILDGGGNLVGAQLLTAPVAMAVAGNVCPIQPVFVEGAAA